METQEYQTLVQTLMSNNLAASASEAQRMAKEMLGISEKVHADSKKEQHYMIKGFKPTQGHVSQASGRPDVDMSTGLPKLDPVTSAPMGAMPQQTMMQSGIQQVPETPKPQEVPQQNIQPQTNISQQAPETPVNHMQEKIDELRQRAINPEPVNVQVDFQTPNLDASQAVQQTQASNISLQSSELPGQSDLAQNAKPTMTPEEYSAQKFGSEPVNNVQSDFLSLKTPQQQPQKQQLNSDWPAQQPQSQPQQQSMQQPQQQATQPSMESTYQEEATEEKTQEVTSPKRETTWTAEEEKLRQEVDLTRVFNFSNN